MKAELAVSGTPAGIRSTHGADLATSKVDAGSLWTGKRHYIAMFLFANLFINYMDRTTLSVAGPAIARQFHWDPATMGLLFSSLLWTYWLGPIPWGAMSDRLGTRKVSAVSVTIWSFAAMSTGIATGFTGMLASRLALGVGESASFPTSGKIVRQWFPAGERGLATAIFNAGTFAGPAVSAPIVAWLVLHAGWRMSFVITGAIGLIWVALWLKMFNVPAECSWLPEAERRYILSEPGKNVAIPASAKDTLIRLLKRKTMWGLFLTQACCAYTMNLFLFWLPSYLTSARKMELMKASWFTAAPYLVAAILGILIGKLSDSLITPEGMKQGKRRTMVIIFILLSTVVLLTNIVTKEYWILLLVSMSLTCISSALTLNIAMTNDLVWDQGMAGTALGILIMGGISFSLLAPIVTGYIVEKTGNFDKAFYVAGGLLFFGALASVTMTRRPLSFSDAEAAA
jgi:MFS family permease